MAALCGASPLQSSYGKTNRHRLNRGGDHGANNALWTIALVRMVVNREPMLTWRDARPKAADRRTSQPAFLQRANQRVALCAFKYLADKLWQLLLPGLRRHYMSCIRSPDCQLLRAA